MFKKIILLIILLGSFLKAETKYINSYTDLKLINPPYTRYIYGDMKMIGNTNECLTNHKTATKQDYENNYKNFNCSNDLNINNDNYIVKYINIDTNNSDIFNSSSAVLKLPSNFKQIVWVGFGDSNSFYSPEKKTIKLKLSPSRTLLKKVFW